jgi:pyrroloquinoline quinone biosynthesis protein B
MSGVRLNRRDFLAAAAALALSPGSLDARRGSLGLAGSNPDMRFPLQPRTRGDRAASELEALVLGTVQDAGLPQPGCYTDLCEHGRALDRAGTPRLVASLALIQPGAGRFHLVDATPDITRQLDLVGHPAFQERAAARDPFDGIFLTHAHIGHYLGLALLGNEGTGIRGTPVYCTERMARFLRENGPWSLMVSQGRIVPTPLALAEPGAPVGEAAGWHRIDDGLEAKLLGVPHRDEYADTVAFVFRRPAGAAASPESGPGPSLLYLPDIDGWRAWNRDVADVVASVDYALLDATFYSADEVPGRSEDEIPHPLVPRTMDRLQGVVQQGGARVILTHLNNSNPALLDGGPEREEIERRGFEVAREGMRLEL